MSGVPPVRAVISDARPSVTGRTPLVRRPDVPITVVPGPLPNLLPDGRPAGPLLDVLRLVAEGHTNAVIAGRLRIATDTVKTRLLVLYRTLGARNRAHAVAEGFRRGYLDGPTHCPDCAAYRPRVCSCGAAPADEETGG